MRPIRNVLILAIAALALGACAAALVPATSDPAKKLGDAAILFDSQGRPLPAERLIVDAMNQYKAANNQLGLAESYRIYGLFFRSRILNQANYAAHYREKGFIDLVAAYDTRYDRSIYYLELAEHILKGADRLDLLSNVYFHLGDVSVLKGDKAGACKFYNQSIAAQAAFRENDPTASVDLPPDAASFNDKLRASKNYAGCT